MDRSRAFALILSLMACKPNQAPSPPGPAEPAPQVPRQVRRLSNQELEAVSSDLLGRPANLLPGLLREPRVEGWDNDVQALLVTDPKLDDFIAIAELLSPQLTKPGCADETCAIAFAGELAIKAYGRPLTEDESTRLAVVYRAGEDPESGRELMVEAMLLSPSFIYRTELGMTGVEIAMPLYSRVC